MTHPDSRPPVDLPPSAHIALILGYGFALPIAFGAMLGWEWAASIPIAAVWMMLNISVIEYWLPLAVASVRNRWTSLGPKRPV